MAEHHPNLTAFVPRLLEIISDLDRFQNDLNLDDRTGDDVAENLLLAEIAAALLHIMDQRAAHFDGALFADPVWCLLLDLYVQEAKGRSVSVSSACIAARVPPTTALRWISVLVERGWIERTPDSFDGRRIHLTLTDECRHRMSGYLLEISQDARRSSAREDGRRP